MKTRHDSMKFTTLKYSPIVGETSGRPLSRLLKNAGRWAFSYSSERIALSACLW